MKRQLYSCLSALAGLLLATPQAIQAQCGLSVSANDTTLCVGESVTLDANVSLPATTLSTTMAAGNNHRGNMFDIVAINAVTITSFEAHPAGNTTYEIYYKAGTFSGFNNNAAAWTLLGSAAVTAQPFGTPTPVPIPVNVTIPAGQTYAFYVTSTNVSVSQYYTNGSTQGAVYASDGNIQFLEGIGLEYPFSGAPFSPRVWNGRINYSTSTSVSYLWNTGDTTASITATPGSATSYSVNATVAGCGTMSDTLVIDINPVVSVSASQIAQATCNTGGSAEAMGSGGMGSLSYLWSNSETNDTISNVPSGNYSVTVTDANSCSVSTSVFISQALTPYVDLGADTTTTCANLVLDAGAGYSTYLWSDNSTGQTLTTSGAGTYAVTVTDANGCDASSTIVVTAATPPAVDLGADTMACAGFTLDAGSGYVSYLWNDASTGQTLNASAAGTYAVTVVDANACEGTDDIVISLSDLGLTLSYSGIPCMGDTTGSVSADAIGGTQPYTYLWSNNQTTNPISGLGAGTYSVTVTDNMACTVEASTTLNEPATLLQTGHSSTDATCSTCPDGSATVSATGGGAPYGYFWENGNDTDSRNDLLPGTYTVTVTDANGCQMVETITISFTSGVGTIAANQATVSIFPNPNNGLFTLLFAQLPNAENTVQMFDAQGRLISSQNTVGIEGSVQFNVNNLPTGVYSLRIVGANFFFTDKVVIAK